MRYDSLSITKIKHETSGGLIGIHKIKYKKQNTHALITAIN